ncbi:MAG: methyltransferase domain-containing protein [Pseudomonadota bacterium]
MNNQTSEQDGYIHGNSQQEQHRLSLINDLLNKACLRELNIQPGDKILDVGCGLGQFSRLMAKTVGEQGHVVGIERDRDQISKAEGLANHVGESDLVEFRQGDALNLTMDETEWGSFEIAHSRFLLEHVSSPEQVVGEMVRCVRPGGKVFISDDDHGNFRPWPQPREFGPIWDAYVRSFIRLGNDPFVGRRLVSLLFDAGLTSVRNTSVFFGGCAGDERFEAVADNLIRALEGAKDTMLIDEEFDEASFKAGIDGLHDWKSHPNSALWYTVCCAEGVVPKVEEE